MKILRFLYYRLYQLQISVGNADIARFSAAMLFSILLMLNISTLVSISYVILGNIFYLPKLSKLAIASIYIAYATSIYFLFARKGEFEKTINLYKLEPEKEKIKGKWVAIIYLISTLLFYIGGMFLMLLKNRGDL